MLGATLAIPLIGVLAVEISFPDLGILNDKILIEYYCPY
jgi:hypothetical protein